MKLIITILFVLTLNRVEAQSDTSVRHKFMITIDSSSGEFGQKNEGLIIYGDCAGDMYSFRFSAVKKDKKKSGLKKGIIRGSSGYEHNPPDTTDRFPPIAIGEGNIPRPKISTKRYTHDHRFCNPDDTLWYGRVDTVTFRTKPVHGTGEIIFYGDASGGTLENFRLTLPPKKRVKKPIKKSGIRSGTIVTKGTGYPITYKPSYPVASGLGTQAVIEVSDDAVRTVVFHPKGINYVVGDTLYSLPYLPLTYDSIHYYKK